MTREVPRWATRGFILLALLALAGIQPAHAQTKDFNVPAQSATTGIPEFARQAGIQILVSEPLVRGKRISAVSGSHAVEEALTILLRGTGLVASTKDGITYTVASAPVTPTSLNSTVETATYGASTGVSPPDGVSSRPGQNKLEEIVVTAQKRLERAQDVPVPVTAISGQTLAESNQLRLQDYYATVPGLSLATQGNGDALLAIRGISTGSGTNSTVAITVDDIPVGTSSALTNNNSFIPDLDPSDLARVEVLRGPQGTLYGASSIGGLIKYVTVDPSTAGLSGRVEATTLGVRNGDTVGYGLRGSVNVPLGETFAVRASGYTRHDPGYIDDPTYDLQGINRGHAEGGRLAALWKPSETFSLKLGVLLQDSVNEAQSIVQARPGFSDLDQTLLPSSRGPDAHISKVRIYSANLLAHLGAADLTSISSYSTKSSQNQYDFNPLYGPYLAAGGARYTSITETRKFTEEVRVSSTFRKNVDWMIGAFYTHERSPVHGPVDGADPVTGAIVAPNDSAFDYSIELAEYAAFADLTLHLTDRFNVQFGGRESSNRQTYNERDSGSLIPIFFGATSPLVIPPIRSKDHSFTYLVTPQFTVSSDLMLYARLASGYRPGGPNADAVLFNFPAHVDPDKTRNYEVGVKGSLFDRKMSFDASAYFIDWKDIQLPLIDPVTFFGYSTNAAGARSKGVELSSEFRPLAGLVISAWTVWNDAKLTDPIPVGGTGVAASAGDRLPFSSRFSANLSIEKEFPLAGTTTGYVRGSANYVGERQSDFTVPGERVSLPSYAQENLLAGVRYASWTVNAFVNNVTDKRGVVSRFQTFYFIGGAFEAAYAYIQPRTFGVSVAKTF